MTRKDFQLIAGVIADLSGVMDEEVMQMLSEDMADALADTNTQFDRTRFLSACGVK